MKISCIVTNQVSLKLAQKPSKNAKSFAGKGSGVKGRKRGNKRGHAW